MPHSDLQDAVEVSKAAISTKLFRVVRLDSQYVMPLIALLFIIISAFVYQIILYFQNDLAKQFALHNAFSLATVIKETRQMYASEVVATLQDKIKVTHDYDKSQHEIPLPATLTIKLGEKLNEQLSDVKVRLFSPYPFAWREHSGGLHDNFDKQAWTYLQRNSREYFFQKTDYQGIPVFRYAKADVMGPSCVQCHNLHPQSLKRDWQTGDVRGVLEIIQPVEVVLRQISTEFQRLWIIFVVLGVLIFALAVWTIAAINKRNRDMQLNRQLFEHNTQQQFEQKLQLLSEQKKLLQANRENSLVNARLSEQSSMLLQSRAALLNVLQDTELAKQLAESGNRIKSQFMANISHELRTPMNGIMGALQYLASEEMAQNQKQFVDLADKSSKQLLRIVDDLLDFSNLERGAVSLNEEHINWKELTENIMARFKPVAQHKLIQLVCKINIDRHLIVIGDSRRVQQAIIYLVDNAIKFTRCGEVEITLDALNVGRDSVDIRIEVRDTGIGIPVEHQAHIFDAFEQGDGSVTRSHGGVGLGLALCKKLVSLFNGELKFSSDPPNGSRFWIVAKFKLLSMQSNPVSAQSM